eukprot:comp22152_c0_seq2/m.32451 comp22152_c0_seq2/g.32451  ORF comp22152_c0_seq2/g.32451 comp22152_c0_seq2/m.32451 type:complete len:623 (-) comp22152_c0_seq2:98-1966(-)
MADEEPKAEHEATAPLETTVSEPVPETSTEALPEAPVETQIDVPAEEAEQKQVAGDQAEHNQVEMAEEQHEIPSSEVQHQESDFETHVVPPPESEQHLNLESVAPEATQPVKQENENEAVGADHTHDPSERVDTGIAILSDAPHSVDMTEHAPIPQIPEQHHEHEQLDFSAHSFELGDLGGYNQDDSTFHSHVDTSFNGGDTLNMTGTDLDRSHMDDSSHLDESTHHEESFVKEEGLDFDHEIKQEGMGGDMGAAGDQVAQAPKRRGRKKKQPLKRVEILKSDEEMKPGLFEEPLIRSGKRERKETVRLDPTPAQPRVKIVVIPEGSGISLGEHMHIREQLSRINALDLKDTFKVLFDKPGLKATVKGDIKKFKGWVFENDEQRQAKITSLEQRSTDNLKFMCDVFNVTRGPDKHSMVRNLFDFLSSPFPQPDDNIKKPTAKYMGPRRRPGPRRFGGSAGDSSDGSQRSDDEVEHRNIKNPKNAYIFFLEEMKPRIEAQVPGINVRDVFTRVGEMWKSLSPMDRVRYDELARLDKQRYDMEMRAATTGAMAFMDTSAAAGLVLGRAQSMPAPEKGSRKGSKGPYKRSSQGDIEGVPKRARVLPSEMDLRSAVEEIVDQGTCC